MKLHSVVRKHANMRYREAFNDTSSARRLYWVRVMSWAYKYEVKK